MSKVRFFRVTRSSSRSHDASPLGASPRFLCLRQDDIADFCGDAVVTSSNRFLEGNFRRNWWGFSGKKSADASLHERYPTLAADVGGVLRRSKEIPASKTQVVYFRGDGNQVSDCLQEIAKNGLAFGSAFLVPADETLTLHSSFLVTTLVPYHPQSLIVNDGRPLPGNLRMEFLASGGSQDVQERDAMRYLRESYRNVLRAVDWLNDQCQSQDDSSNHCATIESLCLPAIGCGLRGYPIHAAVEEATSSLVSWLAKKDATDPLRYVELRFWETRTYLAFVDQIAGLAQQEDRSISPSGGSQSSNCAGICVGVCEQQNVEDALWDGQSLQQYWSEKSQRLKSREYLFFQDICSIQ